MGSSYQLTPSSPDEPFLMNTHLSAVIISNAEPPDTRAMLPQADTFQHGFTYQAHPVATAAGNAVLDFAESQRLFQRVPNVAQALRSHLAASLESHPHVGEVRGLGLLLGIEFVKDRSTREPFPREQNIAEKIRQAALSENVLTYPSQGCVDGIRGDHVLLAPPFVLTPDESEIIARALGSAVARVFST
jgi:adenosylmethionine-8-amino-7-oxononanoate aminotransferase